MANLHLYVQPGSVVYRPLRLSVLAILLHSLTRSSYFDVEEKVSCSNHLASKKLRSVPQSTCIVQIQDT
jgi:hypothetical protein